jgi:hypothetical protein
VESEGKAVKGPIIVVGTGRSGTSTVSRILHENLGVCMGHFLRLHKDHDYYEDLLAHALNRMLAQRALDIVDWRICLAKAHALCDDWGFKDPFFLYATPRDIKHIQPRFFIRTWRPVEQTLDSWIRHNTKLKGRGDTPDNRIHFHRICMEREMLADWKLKDYPTLRISFDSSERLTDKEIEDKIRPYLAEKELEEVPA